jgi:hypothetical protein
VKEYLLKVAYTYERTSVSGNFAGGIGSAKVSWDLPTVCETDERRLIQTVGEYIRKDICLVEGDTLTVQILSWTFYGESELVPETAPSVGPDC